MIRAAFAKLMPRSRSTLIRDMIVIIIPAKGGSGRLPNKNMAPLGGRPMLDYSVEAAKACAAADAIYVSTDSDAIAAHAESLGVAVIRRPESLGGDVPIVEVYRHAVAWIEKAAGGARVETLIGLQPDHPDRDLGVAETLDIFRREGADRLMSTEADGTKNGAHYVLSRHYLDTGESRKDTVIVDDCTNVHYQRDLDRAAKRLAALGA